MMEITDQAGNSWHKEKARQIRFNTGVKCAHVCIPFQCEGCWIRNLEGRDILDSDQLYIKCIRRANLNAMAEKSHLTIGGHRREIVANIKRCELIGKPHPLNQEDRSPKKTSSEWALWWTCFSRASWQRAKLQNGFSLIRCGTFGQYTRKCTNPPQQEFMRLHRLLRVQVGYVQLLVPHSLNGC